VKAFGLLWGVLLILLGSGLLAWIAYNLFVEMQPEASGKSPVVPTAFSLLLVGLGVRRLRQQFKSGSGRSSDQAA
jgi:hypothetical protein